MYPDATFIAIVRDGFALAEGHIRRGADPAKAAWMYEQGCKKIISDEMRIPNYHILKFEDLIGDPIGSLKNVYKFADLDMNMLGKIRLETTKVITNKGEHEFIHNTANKELVWYSLEEFENHYNKDVNENQRERLTKEEEQIILKNAHDTLKHFAYI
ncbi:MAG: sulfotransferase [Methylococcales bacterium]